MGDLNKTSTFDIDLKYGQIREKRVAKDISAAKPTATVAIVPATFLENRLFPIALITAPNSGSAGISARFDAVTISPLHYIQLVQMDGQTVAIK
jgi:hypothetical protein